MLRPRLPRRRAVTRGERSLQRLDRLDPLLQRALRPPACCTSPDSTPGFRQALAACRPTAFPGAQPPIARGALAVRSAALDSAASGVVARVLGPRHGWRCAIGMPRSTRVVATAWRRRGGETRVVIWASAAVSWRICWMRRGASGVCGTVAKRDLGRPGGTARGALWGDHEGRLDCSTLPSWERRTMPPRWYVPHATSATCPRLAVAP